MTLNVDLNQIIYTYYVQVQGQMGVSGAKWRDFIDYTRKGIYIERIVFDPVFQQNLRTQLLDYYFEHFSKVYSHRFSTRRLNWKIMYFIWYSIVLSIITTYLYILSEK